MSTVTPSNYPPAPVGHTWIASNERLTAGDKYFRAGKLAPIRSDDVGCLAGSAVRYDDIGFCHFARPVKGAHCTTFKVTYDDGEYEPSALLTLSVDHVEIRRGTADSTRHDAVTWADTFMPVAGVLEVGGRILRVTVELTVTVTVCRAKPIPGKMNKNSDELEHKTDVKILVEQDGTLTPAARDKALVDDVHAAVHAHFNTNVRKCRHWQLTNWCAVTNP